MREHGPLRLPSEFLAAARSELGTSHTLLVSTLQKLLTISFWSSKNLKHLHVQVPRSSRVPVALIVGEKEEFKQVRLWLWSDVRFIAICLHL